MRHRSKSPYGWAIVILLGIIGGIWLVAEESAYDAAPAPPPSSTTSPADARRPPAKEAATSNVEGRDTRGAPPAARAAENAGSPVSLPLHLAFQSPANARVGEAFDVRVSMDTRQAVGRIVLDIAFDPALLRLRLSEEIDYTHRTPGELPIRVDRSSEGRATLRLVPGASTPGSTSRMSVAVAQFEALAPGSAQIGIENIVVSDGMDRSLSWTASGRESTIAIN